MKNNKGFTPHEIGQLLGADALGLTYVAKDANGQVFAYESKPAKGVAGWGAGLVCHRLNGKFAALSFDDDSPVNIADALAGKEAIT